MCKVDLLFNTEAKPFDDLRIRQALSMAIDRWGGSERLSKITIVKPVGGPLLPGSSLALSQRRARRAAGLSAATPRNRGRRPSACWPRPASSNLKFKLVNRNVNHPFTPVGVFVIDQWRRIGVTAGIISSSTSRQQKVDHRQRRVPGGDRCLLRRQRRSQAAAAALSVEGALAAQHDAQQESGTRCASTTGSRARPNPTQRKALAARDAAHGHIWANSVPVIWYSRLVAHVSADEGLEDHADPFRQSGSGGRLAGPVARGRSAASDRRGRRGRRRAGARHAPRQQARADAARRTSR